MLFLSQTYNNRMATRTKLTPFARLFIFLIIFLPLAYFGAAYYNGEDPVAKLKELVGQSDAPASSSQSESTYNPQDEIRRLKQENAELKQQLKAKDEEIARLKAEGGNRQKWGN